MLDKRKVAEAERLLATVTDRRALPSILRVFPAGGSEAAQARRVRLLGQIDDPSSSRAIAAQAVSTRFLSVRRDAIELLKGRPERDYAADLVEMIHGAVRYEVQPVSGTYSRGALAIDAPQFRMLRTYDVPPAFQLASSFRGYVGYDPNGLPIVVSGRELERMRMDSGSPTAVAADLRGLEARTAALLSMAAEATRLQMAADIQAIETVNQQARIDNANIIPVLESAAGAPASLGDDEDAWHTWWYDKLGYSYQASAKPTIAQDVTPYYQAPYIRTCFAAATPVETLSGPRPIEAIEAGDRVLSQDAATGALSFQPVVFVHRNPPDKTLRISLSDGNSVVCSIYHRFWRANLGWARPASSSRAISFATSAALSASTISARTPFSRFIISTLPRPAPSSPAGASSWFTTIRYLTTGSCRSTLCPCCNRSDRRRARICDLPFRSEQIDDGSTRRRFGRAWICDEASYEFHIRQSALD